MRTDDRRRATAPGAGGGFGLSKLRLVPAITILIFLGLVVWPSWAGYYTTWLWFEQLGYQSVFTTTLQTKFWSGLIVGLISTLVLLVNFKLAMRLSPALPPVEKYFRIEGEQVPAPDFARLLSRVALPAALIIGLFFGTIGWANWETILLYRHQVQFGEADPIFGREIGFYLFTLPFLENLTWWILALMIVCLIGATLIYAGRSAVDSFNQRRFISNLARGPRTHLLALLATIFICLAAQRYFEIPDLMTSFDGVVAGVTYTDLHARVPLLRVQIVASILVAILALATIFLARYRLLIAGFAFYIVIGLVGWLYPAFVQRFNVAPNELVKETPYLQHNISATRKAFALDRIEERELSGDAILSARDIEENQLTIKNIRLWDQQPLLDTFAQIQEIRPYYEFNSIDNDRYMIDGNLQQVMLSARELSSASLSNRNWINERLTFTHGFGLTLGPVDKVTPEGLPVLLIKDLPPVSTVPNLKIERPEIYFGELTNEHVYVRTKAREFNYPSGEENVFENYQGQGGVAIGSLWRRALFATRFGDMKLILSEDLAPESRVIFHRQLRDRLTQVAPYLQFDSDPYLVIDGGRLFWIADAYTTSSRYPYSQPVSGGFNYIRNSVKAVVDAYHGSIDLYIADERDPVILTYARIFEGLLKPLSSMPAGLRAHLRYPEDIFRIQTAVYSTYHMDNPQIFYNKEDQWAAATMGERREGGESTAMDPYYTVMKLPGEAHEEFILMLPFTPKGKSNLASWMVARADGDHYGNMAVYRFPKQKLVYGPLQIAARINQDPEISRQVSLWNQRGSQVNFGTLMVIPIRESLLYVQPLYLRAEQGKIPELRRVVVVAENRIAMEPTLEESLARIFGEGSPSPPRVETLAATGAGTAETSGAATDLPTLAGQAQQAFERLDQARRDGDWARFGEELKRVRAILDQMLPKK